jgi:K+-transporting ATPase, c chain
MFKTMRTAALLFAALTVITGIIYPLAVTGIARLFFPYQASGSVLTRDGKAIGSALLGRSFDNVPRLFPWPSIFDQAFCV